MEKKISVIIPQNEDHTYLIRCLNSICRQSYQDVELILTGADYPEEVLENYSVVRQLANQGNTKEEWISIINKASGDYIYFCSETSVLAPNVFEELLLHVNEDDVFMAAQCMVPDGNNFKICERAAASIYGKMLNRELFLEKLENSRMSESWGVTGAVLAYVNLFQRVELEEEVYVYETEKRIFESDIPVFLSEETQREWIERIRVYPQETKTALVRSWISDEMKKNGIRRAAAVSICVAETMNSEKEVNYEIVKDYVKEWYQNAVDEEQEYLYRVVQEYLGCFDTQEEYQRVLLYACGIGREQYDYMRRCSLEEYLFYKDKLMDEQNFLNQINELGSIRKELEDSRNKIERLQQNVNEIALKRAGAENGIATVDGDGIKLEGPMLAEYVITKYQQGGLGLKTIWKSFVAWVKYKF